MRQIESPSSTHSTLSVADETDDCVKKAFSSNKK
jgi:hypothetical protein